ncbi:MAG: hypothetical protein WC722_05830 [Rhodospirillales bacterium]|jgi:hypothetical protein
MNHQHPNSAAALAGHNARIAALKSIRRDFPTEADCQAIKSLLRKKHGLVAIAAAIQAPDWEAVRDAAAEMGLLMKSACGEWVTPKNPAAVAEPRHPPKRRACMACGRRFLSEGPHHRLCGSCRHESQRLSPYAL